MTDIPFLNEAREGLDELTGSAGELKKAIDLGKEQAKTRDGVIDTVNELSDALQLACDLVAKEFSSTIIEFARVKNDDEEVLRSFFERTAIRYSGQSLRLLLHEGHVCGPLHKLGDRFRQPFSDESTGALSAFQALRAFFFRSSKMSIALQGLSEGERHYLWSISQFLDEVTALAESVAMLPWDENAHRILLQKGEELVQMLRLKRESLIQSVRNLRQSADGVVSLLH